MNFVPSTHIDVVFVYTYIVTITVSFHWTVFTTSVLRTTFMMQCQALPDFWSDCLIARKSL